MFSDQPLQPIARGLAFAGGALTGAAAVTVTLWRSLVGPAGPSLPVPDVTQVAPWATPLFLLFPVGLLASGLILFGASRMWADPGPERPYAGVLVLAGGALAFGVIGTFSYGALASIAGGGLHLAYAVQADGRAG